MRLVEFVRVSKPLGRVWVNPDHVESVTPVEGGASVIRYAGVHDAVVTVAEDIAIVVNRLAGPGAEPIEPRF